MEKVAAPKEPSNMTYCDKAEGVIIDETGSEIDPETGEVKKEKIKIGMDVVTKYIGLIKELEGLEKEVEKFNKENGPEIESLGKQILDYMTDNAIPNITIDGSMVYITSRNIVAFNKEIEEKPEAKREAIKTAFCNKIDSFENEEEAKEFFDFLMGLDTKRLAIEAMKEDEELSALVSENYNSNTLTATLHDLNSTFGELPKSVRSFFTLGSKEQLKVKENEKSKAMKAKKAKAAKTK